MKKYLSIIIFSLIAIIICFCIFDSSNIVRNKKIDENKIDATIVIESYSESNNTAQAKIIIKNNNGFDIILYNIVYSDDDLEIYSGFESPMLIQKNSIFETVFPIEIKNVSLKENDLLKEFQNKNIMINLANAYAEINSTNIHINPKFEIQG